MQIRSTVLTDGQPVPPEYTCDGEDKSPPVMFVNVPEEAETLVLVCDDPDAPVGTWTHWTVFNLPGNCTGLDEDVSSLPGAAKSGVNSWGRTGYGGPCPPTGTHRYFFRLYATDTVLNLDGNASRADIMEGIKDNILAEAEMMCPYMRQG